MKTQIVFKEESYKIIGVCFEVYKEKGNGFLESVKLLADQDRAQVINYLRAMGKQLGLLVNFGHYPKIEHELFINQSLSRF
ncbi:MAG: hypothetical protein JRJ77_13885 [Deltaproteobacteria bacterium]|nr:hypothetical protein [Deltaproteobacteria bacterium]MBW2342029.1 hypothetical protein [Deltaproteobacteria bacterium]